MSSLGIYAENDWKSRPLMCIFAKKTAHRLVLPVALSVHAPVTMKFLLTGLTALAALSSSANALYFYLDGTAPKCFYEELPKDTLVVGQLHFGHAHPDDILTFSQAPTKPKHITHRRAHSHGHQI